MNNKDNKRKSEEELKDLKAIEEILKKYPQLHEKLAKSSREITDNMQELKKALRDNVKLSEQVEDGFKKINDLSKDSVKLNRKIDETARKRLEILQKDLNLNKSKTRILDDINTRLASERQLDEAIIDLVTMKSASAKKYENQLIIIKGIQDALLKQEELKSRESLKQNIQNNLLKDGSKKLFDITKSLFSTEISGWSKVYKLSELVLDRTMETNKIYNEQVRSVGMSAQAFEQINASQSQLYDLANKEGITRENMFKSSADFIKSYGGFINLQGESVALAGRLSQELGIGAESSLNYTRQLQASLGLSDTNATHMLKAVTVLADDSGVSAAEVFAEIKDASSQLLGFMGGNVHKMALANIELKKMGLNLEKASGQADSLLNIETSLAAQFEATVLTGQHLNFERARELALSGDIAGASKEVLNQMPSISKFNSMNVLQKQAMAKAAGLEVKDLLKALETQKMKTLFGKSTSDMSVKELRAAIASGKIKDDSLKKQLEEQLIQKQNLDIQTRLANVAEKILDGFAPLIDLLMIGLEKMTKVFELIKGSSKQISITLGVSILFGITSMVKKAWEFVNALLQAAKTITNIARTGNSISFGRGGGIGGIGGGAFPAGKVINPNTGRMITEGGKTHQNLVKSGAIAAQQGGGIGGGAMEAGKVMNPNTGKMITEGGKTHQNLVKSGAIAKNAGGAAGGVGGFFSKIGSSIGKVATSVGGVAKNILPINLFKAAMGKLGGIKTILGKLLKVGPVAAILETIMAGIDIKSLADEGGKGMENAVGKRFISAFSTIGGSVIGSLLGPAGTIAGSLVVPWLVDWLTSSMDFSTIGKVLLAGTNFVGLTDTKKVGLARGGIVYPRRGGVDVTVAEGGKPEIISPIDVIQKHIRHAVSMVSPSPRIDMTPLVSAINELKQTIINNKVMLKIDGREFGKLVTETTSQKIQRA